jgi:hypothetical protein
MVFATILCRDFGIFCFFPILQQLKCTEVTNFSKIRTKNGKLWKNSQFPAKISQILEINKITPKIHVVIQFYIIWGIFRKKWLFFHNFPFFVRILEKFVTSVHFSCCKIGKKQNIPKSPPIFVAKTVR